MDTRPAMHRRTASEESSSSRGSAHRLILEHILNYPGTYELPLRTMYALNSVPRAQPLPKAPAGTSQTPMKTGEAAHKLTCSLMAEISQMPNQPTSLPPAFITSFVRKCFASEINLVDFPQALTGLDYLKDLESRRCREMKAALERLDIKPENSATAEETLQEKYPAVLEWYRSLDERVHKVEALYTQLYVALRRWILINELSLTPYSRHNCLAMLNTIYPPIISSTQPTPTKQLTHDVLKRQRDGFFRYIQTVEKGGSDTLTGLIAQGKRPGEETGWPATREILDKYLQTANSMIDECLQIVPIDEAVSSTEAPGVRGGRKADSGISFLDSRKSSTSSEKSQTVAERPVSRSQHKSSTTLEKIAREIRHIRRNKTDISEMIPQVQVVEVEAVETASSNKSVRKMKSLSSINLRRSASRNGSASSSSKDIPKFDQAEMRKQRQAYEIHMMTAAG